MCITEYLPEIISGTFTILAAVVAVLLGIWGFFRQKEYELVQRRYLEEGLDIVIATAENALNTFHHNWARSLELLKLFRDLETIKPEDLDQGFLALPADRFALTANYRLNQLTDSDTIWRVFQLVIAFAERANSVARVETPTALKMKLTTDTIEATRKEMVDAGLEALTELDKESHHYHSFVGELQAIARLVEGQRFSLKGIRKLRTDPIVKNAISNLETKFSEQLKEH